MLKQRKPLVRRTFTPLKRSPLRKESPLHKANKLKTMGEMEKMIMFFQDLWDSVPEDYHRCYETGEKLYGGPLTVYFHHILPKEQFSQYKYSRWNICLVTLRIHDTIHRRGVGSGLTPKINKLYLELLEKHNNFELTP